MKIIDVSSKKYPNLFTLVDDEDYEYLNQWKWRVKKTRCGYYVRRNTLKNNKNTSIIMHRVLMNLKENKKVHVDHIDHNTLNNQKNNLRVCTIAQNQWNQISIGYKKNRYSKYKGVHRYGIYWRVRISKNKRRFHIGVYKNEIEAALAYDKKANELYGEFACLNFPDGQK